MRKHYLHCDNFIFVIGTLGEKLKSARKSVGLTQEQLADKLMVLRQAITKWETDKGIENNVDKP
jgi:DNA-binding XRE family transcriptional regulator